MEVSAHKTKSGEYQLEIGPVTFELTADATAALSKVISQRLSQSGLDAENLHRKLKAYRAVANKLAYADDAIIQKFSTQLAPEQLITLVRLADGDSLYNKVARNLSKQNRRQFEDDFNGLNKITEHAACLHMEQIVPLIKKTAQEQKALQEINDTG
ncbi:FliG C-terminal domain-containing protein [Thiomicrorhabdus sediminis]|uniref:Flagellar motor switch protein FliG C-terminal domain-containing protein n=1 Tax=Thiomicrorhabdus sediminis TaxID=2580412 RepID=A0A4P9K7D6_9GAMM|nr:FliG C-terminal domain-containing protein [Thiomicrorhabdus sediminis]QCU90821.1 hypothetical protein FE785_09370 [Thiomicrorhabdus sediminis]